MRRLEKSRDKKIAGVCGGIAEHFGWDPTVVRVVCGIAIFCYGTGLIAYIIAAIVMPESSQ